MDIKQFINEFGHMVNVTNGIARLRTLIIQLAISGKLTKRIPDDTSASILIEDNIKNRNSLVKKKKLKRQVELGSIERYQVPWELPIGWEWVRLGTVTNYGETVKSGIDSVSDDTWILELEDIEKNTSRLIKKVLVKERRFKSTKNKFKEGDILYGKLRPYLDKVLIAESSGVCTSEIIPISFFDNIEPGYLRWYLKSPYFIKYADSSTYGMNLPRLGTESARMALFPFPPKKEQSVIVAKIDQLMMLCDLLEKQLVKRDEMQKNVRRSIFQNVAKSENSLELSASWNRLAKNFGLLFSSPHDVDEIRALILDLAVRGLLIEHCGNEEKTSEFTADDKITNSGKSSQSKIKKYAEINKSEYPFQLPEGWIFVRLGQITSKIGSGSTPKGGQAVYVKQGIPFLRSQNVWNDGLRLNDVAYITVEQHNKMSSTAVNKGDVLLNITGASLGRCALVKDDIKNANVSQHVSIIRSSDVCMSEFLHICLLSPYIQKIMQERQIGMAREGLSKQTIEQLEVPLPPVAEQNKIVIRVNEMMHLCDIYEAQLTSLQTVAEQMNAAAIGTITGVSSNYADDKSMKAPQTELISSLRLGKMPTVKEQAPLASILARNKGELESKDLWRRFGGNIDAFYAQLKIEIAYGWIEEPNAAVVKEKLSVIEEE